MYNYYLIINTNYIHYPSTITGMTLWAIKTNVILAVFMN